MRGLNPPIAPSVWMHRTHPQWMPFSLSLPSFDDCPMAGMDIEVWPYRTKTRTLPLNFSLRYVAQVRPRRRLFPDRVATFRSNGIRRMAIWNFTL
jgi:hypothetical protein